VAVAGLGLTVFAAKLMMIAACGSDVPFWDQWDAEAAQLIRPFVGGGDWWSALLRPHNEHHILGTRLLTVGLLAVNGQWDPLLEMAAGAFISAAGIATLLSLGRGLQPTARWVWAGVLSLAGVLPFGWENTLCGFQNQIYLVVLGGISVLAMASDSKGAGVWAVATVAALATGFSMAGGFLLAAPFVILAVLGWISRPRRQTPALRWMASAVLLAAAAWWTRNPVPEHDVLRVPDYPSFAGASTTYLAWPLSPGWLWFIPMMCPVFALVVRRWRCRAGPSLETFALVLCTWGVAIAVVLAWSRGGQYPIGTEAPSRYLDMLILVPVANALALLLLWQYPGERRNGLMLNAAGLAWMAAMVAGLGMIGFGGHAGAMIGRLSDPTLGARTLTRALRAGNGAILQNARPEALTYPDATMLWNLLQDSAIGRVLPASLQPPLAFAWRNAAGDLRGEMIDGPGIPVAGPLYSSFVGHGPHRVETVRTEPFETPSGGVIFDVYVSLEVRGTIELIATDNSWRRAWRLEEFAPSSWEAVTEMLPRCPVFLKVTTESSWGGVVVTPPRWIAHGSALVRQLLGMSRALVVVGAVVMVLGLGFSTGNGSRTAVLPPAD
jgi:hypothetical protein